MTDIQGNSDHTQAAKDAAERVSTATADAAEQVSTATADAAESLGAKTEQIADEVSASAEAASSDGATTVSDINDKVNEKVGEVVDAAKNAAAQASAAAADAAKAATASIKNVAGDVDLDSLFADTKVVAGEWTDKLKQTYRERPGVVIAAAAGAVVVLGAIVRSIGRR